MIKYVSSRGWFGVTTTWVLCVSLSCISCNTQDTDNTGTISLDEFIILMALQLKIPVSKDDLEESFQVSAHALNAL